MKIVWPCFLLLFLCACNTKPTKGSSRQLSSIQFENTVYEFAISANPQSCNPDSIPATDCGGGYLYLTADGKAILLDECIGDADINYDLGAYTKCDTGITCTFSDRCSVPYPRQFDAGISAPEYEMAIVGKLKSFALQLNTLSCDKFDFYSQKQVESKKNLRIGFLKLTYWKADSIHRRTFLKNAMQAKFLSEWFRIHADKVSLANSCADTMPAYRVLDFMKWYADHLKRLNKFEMVNHVMGADTTQFYSVNFEQTEEYLSELFKSGFLSNEYLDLQRSYFKRSNDSLLKNPQNDGPPYGFSYDLIMHSQEYDEDLAHLEKAQIKSQVVKGNAAAVTVIFATRQELDFALKRQGGKWTIVNID